MYRVFVLCLLASTAHAYDVGLTTSGVKFYRDSGEVIERRSANPAEARATRAIRLALREARSLGVNEDRLTADNLIRLAGATRTKEIRADQWTLGRCGNVDHWPQIYASVPSRLALALALSRVSPTLLASGSHWDSVRRAWIIGDGGPRDFDVPATGIGGSFTPDARVWVPRNRNRTIGGEAAKRVIAKRNSIR